MKHARTIFLTLVVTTLISCSSSSDSETNPEANFDSADYYYFISGKMNGESFLFGQRIDDTVLNYQLVFESPLEGATCAYSQDQGLDYKISYLTSVYPDFDNEDSQPSMGIDFVRFYRCSDTQSSTEVFNDLFGIGDYEYASDNSESGTMKQIGITYSPIATGDPYYESYGTIASSNSFKITATEEYNDYISGVLVAQNQLVEGEFTAKLYHADNSSDVIEITEGRFKIIVTK